MIEGCRTRGGGGAAKVHEISDEIFFGHIVSEDRLQERYLKSDRGLGRRFVLFCVGYTDSKKGGYDKQ